MVRGSGAAWDLRRAQPYECYTELDFDIPDRQERRQLRPLLHPHGGDAPVDPHHEAVHREAALAGRPGAGRASTTTRSCRRKRGEMKRSMEALIHHFKLYTEGFHVPAGEVYAAVEAPKGEFGVYLVSDGTNKPYKCKIRAPGFAHLQAMDFLCKGHMLADVSADPRLARHRVRGGRPLMAVRRLAAARNQPKASPSRRRTRLGADADREIPARAAGLGGDPAAVARAGAGAAGCREAAIEHVAEMLGMANIRVLEVATFYTMFNLAAGRQNPCAGVHHHAVHAARLRRARRGLPAAHRRADARLRRRQVLLDRGRVPRRLRERADGADRQGLLRGPTAASFEKILDDLAAARRRSRARRSTGSSRRRSAGRRR